MSKIPRNDLFQLASQNPPGEGVANGENIQRERDEENEVRIEVAQGVPSEQNSPKTQGNSPTKQEKSQAGKEKKEKGFVGEFLGRMSSILQGPRVETQNLSLVVIEKSDGNDSPKDGLEAPPQTFKNTVLQKGKEKEKGAEKRESTETFDLRDSATIPPRPEPIRGSGKMVPEGGFLISEAGAESSTSSTISRVSPQILELRRKEEELSRLILGRVEGDGHSDFGDNSREETPKRPRGSPPEFPTPGSDQPPAQKRVFDDFGERMDQDLPPFETLDQVVAPQDQIDKRGLLPPDHPQMGNLTSKPDSAVLRAGLRGFGGWESDASEVFEDPRAPSPPPYVSEPATPTSGLANGSGLVASMPGMGPAQPVDTEIKPGVPPPPAQDPTVIGFGEGADGAIHFYGEVDGGSDWIPPRPVRKAPASVHFGDEIPQINDPVEASRAEKGHEVHAEGSANLDWVPGWVEETDNALMQFRAWIVQLESKLENQAQKQKPAEFQQKVDQCLKSNNILQGCVTPLIEAKIAEHLGEIQAWISQSNSNRDEILQRAVNLHLEQIREKIYAELGQKVDATIQEKILAHSLDVQKLKTEVVDRMQTGERGVDRLKYALANLERRIIENQQMGINMPDLEQIRVKTDEAMRMVENMQGLLRAHATSTMTAKQVRAEIQGIVSKAQFESLKNAQLGGQAAQAYVLGMVEKLNQTTEARLEARIAVLDKENEGFTKKLQRQEKEIEEMKLEQVALRMKVKEILGREKAAEKARVAAPLPFLHSPNLFALKGGVPRAPLLVCIGMLWLPNH